MSLRALIGPEPLALMRGRVSILVGSRDAGLCPHVTRAVGCRLADDLSTLALVVPATSGSQVLADLRANGEVAVVFSQPTTDRTVQLKGHGAQVGLATAADRALAAEYLRGFTEELGRLGFAPELAARVGGHEGEDLAVVRFVPAEAFEQTPGPQAGQLLGGPHAAR